MSPPSFLPLNPGRVTCRSTTGRRAHPLAKHWGLPPGGAVTADRLIHAIDGLRKAQDEDKTGSKGVVSALKEPEKLDVFLARGCGETQVELCPGVYGKELFHGIKRAGHHAKHMLQLIRWPVLISNRLALAIAGLWWGGEESYTLLASDCATAKAEQVEAWTPPTEHKIESRARAPAAFLTWLRYAENAVKVFGSAYGLEHVPERMAFLAALREANEEDENAFPVGYCIKLYEELNAVWCEQIRESRRKLCAKLGTENPRLEDLKLVALSPGPDGAPAFQFPRVWDLQDPQGYYQQVILPRQQRAMTRLWNKQLHEQALSSTRRSNKTAGNEETTDPGDAADPKAGKGPNLRLKRNDREEAPSGPTAEGPTDKSGEPPRKAYPAGDDSPRKRSPDRLNMHRLTLRAASPFAGMPRAISVAIARAARMRTSRYRHWANWTPLSLCKSFGEVGSGERRRSILRMLTAEWLNSDPK